MNVRQTKIAVAQIASQIVWTIRGKKKFIGKQIPVLAYHRVLPDFAETETPMYSVLPEQFGEQMKYLADHGFKSLSLDEYDEILRGEREVPERAVMITFDDGYSDIYSIAMPIARYYCLKLNVFICTGFIAFDKAFIYPETPLHAFNHNESNPDWWRPLSWQEIKTMREEGMGIGFHGHTHRKMGQLSALEIHREFEKGLQIYTEKLGVACHHFAFPNGTADSYDETSVAIARHYGMQRLFTTRLKRTPIDAGEQLISRLTIHQEDDLETFKLKLYGAYDWLGALRHLGQLGKASPKRNFSEVSLSRKLQAEKAAGGRR